MIKAVAIIACVAHVALAGVAQAPVQLVSSNPTVGQGGANTVRGVAGLSSVTHQAKTLNGAFSSASKTDTRITNDAVAVQQPVQYAAQPLQYHTAVQPVQQLAQPVQYQQVAQAQPVQYQVAQQVAQPVQYQVAQQVAQPVQYQVAQQVAQPVQYQVAQQVAQPVQVAQQLTYAQPQQITYARAPVAYATKTVATAPVVAKAVSAPTLLAQPVKTLAAAPLTKTVAAAPLAKTVPTSLLGVAYSPVQLGTASLYFNGLGASYSLFPQAA